MSRCTGTKGDAKSKFANKSELAQKRLETLPYDSKEELYSAVYADGKIYTISGCEGLEFKKEEKVRVLGKDGNVYKVAIGNEIMSMTCEELSKIYTTDCKSTEQHKAENKDVELDR